MIDITRLKQESGVAPFKSRIPSLQKEGSEYKGRCPFHNDSNPSFALSKKNGEWLWHCFPCKEGGDVIRLVEKIDHCDFRTAVNSIADELGIKFSDTGDEPESPTRPENGEKKKKSAIVCDASAAIPRLPEAKDFLNSRGISLEIAREHNVGIIDFPGLGPSVTLPYDDADVKVRAIQPKDKEHKFRHFEGHPTNKLLYNLETLDGRDFAANPQVFLCESELDALTLESHGFHAVSVSTASGCLKKDRQTGELSVDIDPAHLEKLLERAHVVYLALDMDKAGQECADAFEKVLPSFKARRLSWEYRKGEDFPKDVGEIYARDPQAFKATIERLRDESNIPVLWRQAATFKDLPRREYEWIVDELIPKDDIALLTGDFGSFKSYLSYFLADAISAGKPFINRKSQKHPILVLDRENSHATVYLRRSLVGELSQRDNVRILGLFTTPQAPEFTDPKLLRLCHLIKPVIIVDSLTDFHPVLKESDPDDMTEVFGQIRALLTAGAVSVIVLHHVSKNGSNYRGTTSIPAAVSTAIKIQKASGNRAKLSGFKNRSGEDTQIELQLNFTKDSVTYKVLSAGLDPIAEQRTAIEDYVKDHTGCTVAEMADALERRKQDVADAVEELTRTGVLERKMVSSNGGRPRETYRIREDLTRWAELTFVPELGNKSPQKTFVPGQKPSWEQKSKCDLKQR